MAANTSPIFPGSPVIGVATFTSATAITSRANITGTTGLTALVATSTNGTRVDAITVKGKGVNVVATNVFVWLNNGTTSFLFDEIDIPSVTPAVTSDSVVVTKTYTTLVVPPTWSIYVSESVQADVNVFAFGGAY